MFDLERIARIVAGEFCGRRTNCALGGISTDSRKVRPGELFIPLRGENFDGHDYLAQAVQNGAAACLSEEVIAGLSVPVVRVPDCLKALGEIAAVWRLQLRGPLIAVTGSAGKTTTKEMLATILEQQGPGLKTPGNFNNLIGLPLTLLQLEASHQWAVIEMGTSGLGEIERLTRIAQPTIGAITNIGAAHLEGLHGLDGVSRAKGELFAGLNGGTAVVNLDDSRVARLPIANGVKRLTCGLDPQAEVRAETLTFSAGKTCFELCYAGQRAQIALALVGEHLVSNALIAAAAAISVGLSLEEIARGLERFRPVAGRLCPLLLSDGRLLIDDSYNANPLSAAAALQALTQQCGFTRKIAVLGDMLELGESAVDQHTELGSKAAAVVDLLIAVGDYNKYVREGALKAGLAADKIVLLDDAETAAVWLLDQQQPGDLVLIKGSRGVGLDKVVTVLQVAAAQGKGS